MPVDLTRVPVLRRDPERSQTLLRELGRFAAVGLTAYGVDMLLFVALRVGLGLDPFVSKGVSATAAISLAFVLNRAWSFSHRVQGDARREGVLFALVNVGGFAIALACLFVSHTLLGLTSPLADTISVNGVGLVLGTIFRFLCYKRFVWVSEERHAAREQRREQRAARRELASAA